MVRPDVFMLYSLKLLYQKHANWSLQHQLLFGWLFWIILGWIVLFDLYLRLYLQVESISSRVWDECAAHPTLVGAIFFFTFYIAYLVRTWRGCIAAIFLLCGHLALHE